MPRKQITLASCLLIAACSSTIPTHIIDTPPVYHPAFPDPYTVCALSSDAFDVLEHNGDAVITLSYNDNLTVAICDKDKDTYIKRLLNLTCYYRQDLKERICTKDINE